LGADDRGPTDRRPAGVTPAIAPDESFDGVYGLELLDDGARDGCLRGRVAIRDELRQQFGLVHGGVIAATAEALASWGTWLAVHEDGKVAMGLSNETSFMRPLRDGHLHATARPRHKGRTHWVWGVECRDDEDRLCAITTVTVAVRAQPGELVGHERDDIGTRGGAGGRTAGRERASATPAKQRIPPGMASSGGTSPSVAHPSASASGGTR